MKNNIKLNRKLFNIGAWVGLIGVVFWAVETIIFLIIQGWHVEATHEMEILCDSIASSFFNLYVGVNFLATVLTCIMVNDALIKEKED